jgi:endonuclease/exonuclease/phosphatase family metal-dependent hydrolase
LWRLTARSRQARACARSSRLIAAACAVALYVGHAHAQKSPSLRVLHWNVLHSGFGTDGVLDRARQVKWMVAQAPDVITLNEVTESAAFEYQARLRVATGRGWFLHHVAAVSGREGNAILTHYPIRANGGRVLTHERSVAQVTIDVAGSPVNVFSTHIESGRQRQSRAEQIQMLLPYLARFPPPRIVNGDLNAGPPAAEIQPLLASYIDAWEEAMRSNAAVAYPDNPRGRTRGARIDYILISPDGGLRVTGCAIPDQRDMARRDVITEIQTSDDEGVRPSDHNLIWCTFERRLALPSRR